MKNKVKRAGNKVTEKRNKYVHIWQEQKKRAIKQKKLSFWSFNLNLKR
jgi:hypothetical protein